MEILGIVPVFGNVLFTLAAFVIALSVIVAVHEYGHYIVGRWCGIRAEVFSLGFGPVIYARPDKRGTVWQIAALPFGGYVKFLGDANAASAGDDGTLDQMDAATRRQTMHGAPIWARSATVAAGPVFNFILSTLIFAVFVMFNGVTADPVTVDELVPLDGVTVELEPGDQILEIGGLRVPAATDLGDFVAELPRDSARLDYLVLRNGDERVVTGPHPYTTKVAGFSAPVSAAEQAGMQLDDLIVAVNGEELRHFYDLLDRVEGSGGEVMQFTVLRGGEELSFDVAPRILDLPQADGSFRSDYKIGVGTYFAFAPGTETPGPVAALAYGVDRVWYIAKVSLSALYNIVTLQIDRCNMSGPVGIAKASADAASQGLDSLIWFIAVLSTAVGLLNLFPIPVLDGGHLVFHAYEAVFRRPPNEKVLHVLMTGGLMLILSLMVFALTNDFTCP